MTVGVALFRRVGRRVELTPSGRSFANELSDDLERIRQTVFRAIAAGSRNRVLQIATLPTFANRWLIPRLLKFESQHPNIQINLSTRLTPVNLSQDRFDAAVHFGGRDWPDTDMFKLCGEVMVPVASRGFIERYKVKGAVALVDAPLLHLETRPSAWSDWFRRAGVDGVGALPGKHFDQFSIIISAAIASLGAGLAPRLLIQKKTG